MPPKKMPETEVIEVVEEKPKSKRGGLRKMNDKEKEVFKKLMEGKGKSESAKLRMKVLRSEKPVDTPAKLKKLMT